ncbi:MAG TPA: dihydropteroate synthase [Chloroflexota bacterium]|nr:dihydropteroate synthase [Chloroflexota bacterium]
MTLPGALGQHAPGLRAGVRTLVMGILNLTPDSFSGDGVSGGPEAALRRAEALVAAGADILDVGGESTRPGHTPVSEDVELERVLPALNLLAGRVSVPISIDTRKSRVAEAALAAGATIVNDVSGLTFDPRLPDVTSKAGASLIVGHWRPRQPDHPDEPADLIEWLAGGLAESVRVASAAGIPRTRLIVDPGLGFAKLPPVSIAILGRLRELRAHLGLPMLIGASRKGFVGAVLDRPVEDRLEGSLATVAVCVQAGIDAVRVHDVGPAARVARMSEAILYGWSDPMPAWTPIYLGLGANLGDRAGTIARAIQELDEHRDIRVLRRASLYETAPVGVTAQPAFLNTVVEVLSTLSGRPLLDAVKRVERTLGRQSRERWGPREIDVDILLHGATRLEEPGLEIPHRHMWERLFVLEPLAELRPDFVGPDGRPIAVHVQSLKASQEARSLGW